MYTQQTFFGPEGVFVASSSRPLRCFHQQHLSHQKKRSSKVKFTVPTAAKGNASGVGTNLKPKVFSIPVPLKSDSPGKGRRDRRKREWKESPISTQWVGEEGHGKGRLGEGVGEEQSQLPWMSSLSDLSSHPQADEDWYKVKPEGADDHTHSLENATPSSYSLMEVSPLTTPTREAEVNGRKLAAAAVGIVTKGHRAKHRRASQRCKITTCKSAILSSAYPAQDTRRLPPNDCEMMQSAEPKTREPSAGSKTNLQVGCLSVPSLLRPKSVEVTLVPLSPEKTADDVFSTLRVNSSVEMTDSEVNLSDYPPSPYELDLVGNVDSALVPASSFSSAWCPSHKSPVSNGGNPGDNFALPVPRTPLHYHINPIIITTSEASGATLSQPGGQESKSDDSTKVRKSVLKSSRSSSGMGMPLSPLRAENKVGVGRDMEKEKSPQPSVSPYAVSVINSPVPRNRTNHAHRVTFQLDMPFPSSPKSTLAPGEYDLVDDHYSCPSSAKSRSHSNFATSSPIQIRRPQDSKSDNTPQSFHSCCSSGLSQYDSPSSRPALFYAGSLLFSPQPSRGRNKIGDGCYNSPQPSSCQQVWPEASSNVSPHNGQTERICPSSPRGGIYPSSPRGGICPSSPRGGICPSSPRGGICQPSPRRVIYPSSPRDGIFPSSPRGGICPSSPRGGICQPSPRRGIYPSNPRGPSSPRGGICQLSPRRGIYPSSPRVGICPSSPRGGFCPSSPRGGFCPRGGIYPSSPRGGICPSSPRGGICQLSPRGGICPSSPRGGICQLSPRGGICPSSPRGGICQLSPRRGNCPSSPRGGICQPKRRGGIQVNANLSLLSPLSGQNTLSSPPRSGWVWPNRSDVWSDTTDRGVSRPHKMPQDSMRHYQTPRGIPITRVNRFLHAIQTLGFGPVGEQQEPNLKDVVQFLHSDDRVLISNAASYVQHLAYGDNNMQNKIREHGAIPILVDLIHHTDTKVQITALGALKNLSYGRTTNENKHLIANDQRLVEIVKELRSSRVAEIRDLLTGLLWNLSSCEELKLRMIKSCLHDLVEIVMVPYTGWNTEDSREATSRPRAVVWNNELKNTTGTLRNMSSAGESARSFMRNTNGMVDTLLWLLKAGVQQKSAADEKTVENTVCILRNLSYRLEKEIDPQEGGDDILDREWEQEQQKDKEELSHSFSKNSPGCLPFCVRPRTKNKAAGNPIAAAIRPVYTVDFVFPDASVMPKRHKPVYGKSLLWQPEVAFVYLAVLEQYPDCVDTLESAAGAIQNLTACQWKWSTYICNTIRTSSGLQLLGDLLCNAHDTVVRPAALALRNLAEDRRNTVSLGVQSIINIQHRLPYGMNHLGISEETSVALLSCLVELFTDSPENAQVFRENEGIALLTRLARSRQHTSIVTTAAHRVCAQLWDYKECKSLLKKMGWEMCQYHHLAKSADNQMELDLRGGMSSDYHGSQRKKRASKRSSKKSSRKKDRDRERERAEAEVGFIAGGLPPTGKTADVHPQNPASGVSNDSSHSRSQLPEISDYQTIPAQPALPSSAHPSNHVIHHQSPEEERHLAPSPPPGPNYESVPLFSNSAPVSNSFASAAIIYQSIDDLPLMPSVQSARTDVATTPSTTTNGGLSTTSLEEEAESDPDPCSTYAVVDKEKKRASRWLKEQQKKEEEEREKQRQQQLEPDDPLDSWV